MRILHIVTAFPRRENDVITPWLAEMLRREKAAGIEPEVFTPSYQGLGDQIMFGLTVHRFRYFFSHWEDFTHDEMAVDRMSRSLRYKLMPAFYLLFGVRAIWKLCRRNRYDAIHVHWPVPHAVFGYVAKLASGAKIVTTYYGAELRWVKHSLPFLKGFVRWSAAISDRVVAISTYTASQLQPYTDKQIEVIPYTVGFPDNSEFKIQNSEFKGNEVLTVGRLVERKGVCYLIEGFALLPQALNARLVIAGGGPLLEELRSFAADQGVADRVTFTGRISEQELIARYRSAAVYVQPAIIDSRGDTEMLGVVLLEAIHYGVPVIGSAVGGISDIIIDGATGLLVPEKNPKALAVAIERIIADQGLKKQLVEKASQHLVKNFNWDTIVNKWITLYKSII